jgi:carbonic anhydrase
VHRNIANLVPQSDSNVLSVLQYAVDVLRVGHIIVCGHFGCGGIQAALQMRTSPPLKNWLEYVCQIYRRHQKEIDALPDEEARWTHMCELNVAAQVQALRGTEIVQAAWKRNQPLVVHGWIYDLHSGLLHDLDLSVDAPQASRPIA